MSIQVTICTFNHARALARTLDRVFAQACAHDLQWSVVVVDNNSTDDTAGVVQRARLQHGDRISCLTESQQGVGFARRRALRETTADWIAFVDDDCLLDPAWLASAAAFIELRPNAGAIGGRVEVVFPDGASDLARRNPDSFAAQDYGPVARDLSPQPFVRLVGAGLLVRRLAVERSGWLRDFRLTGRAGLRLGAGDDTELVLAIRNAGFEIWYAPDLLLKHEIAFHRTTPSYLVRMHVGFGEAGPFLQARAGTIRLDSTSARLRFLARQCGGLAWYGLRWSLAALLRNDAEPDRRLDLCRMWGRFGSACRLALDRSKRPTALAPASTPPPRYTRHSSA